ncbi:transport-associated protein [Pandoraea aquatica]|uniref:Transport-associated protein n=1 Tax=Pandoraea aquatica TaxID=2508290 RepID=A0A5E4RCL1_9BURK|nr:BON domain-containing protein [Pandoraea aquatica]VVD61030.1 transport-associated protein [Pandoraea aquatica]
MAKRNPPSPTPPTETDKRGLVDEGTQEGTQSPSEHEQHALTHEDGDAETQGAPIDAVKRNAKASNVRDIEGEAGQAAGSRGRSGGSGGGDAQADGAVHDAIRESLSAAIDLDVSHVEVTVTSGLVLLTGYVPERWMQHVVQTEVERIDGVKGVDNRLHERRMKSMSRPGESQEGHKI